MILSWLVYYWESDKVMAIPEQDDYRPGVLVVFNNKNAYIARTFQVLDLAGEHMGVNEWVVKGDQKLFYRFRSKKGPQSETEKRRAINSWVHVLRDLKQPCRSGIDADFWAAERGMQFKSDLQERSWLAITKRPW